MRILRGPIPIQNVAIQQSSQGDTGQKNTIQERRLYEDLVLDQKCINLKDIIKLYHNKFYTLQLFGIIMKQSALRGQNYWTLYGLLK
ncbi:unnamed protein product [Paramecium primaurelia]|uniref:Uncharacterized protein n=1 Tax=Paramecium primaurelia TaxID=5886 RepID=A0A8S1QM50_PARPR|nr:unnamed protein product [Paramecium primaurelia]